MKYAAAVKGPRSRLCGKKEDNKMSDPNRPPFDPDQPPSAFPPNSPHAPPGSAGGPPQPVPYATRMSYGYPGPYTGPTPTPDDRTWGMLAHLAALAGFIVPVVGNIVGPLIVWLTKKEQQPFVDDQGKESLNFQITMV